MFKKFVANTLYSLLYLILMSLFFIFGGFLVLELFKTFSYVVIMIIFSILLCLGCIMAKKLYFDKAISVISIVLMPTFILVVLYGLCLVGIPIVSMIIQYPAVVWAEAFSVNLSDNPLIFYSIDLLHYLICSLSLFAGAYKKQKIKC